jgi:hypothetical protein
LVDRTFDREESLVVITAKEYMMQHASAIRFRLLACVEDVECHVCCDRLLCCAGADAFPCLG